MKKFLVFLCAVILVFSVVGSVSATVLTFDDISSGSGFAPVPDGYGGLNWNIYYLNAKTYRKDSGYKNSLVSGEYIAYCAGNGNTIVSNNPFNFNGAYLTAAWNNGLNIKVLGYRDNNLLYDQTVTVNTYKSTWFDFNYFSIDKLEFHSWGGEYNNDYSGTGTHFAMDNFTFNEIAPVPEPSTMLLLGAGMLGLAGLGRKKLTKKA